jgi:signal transduction histidine kinase
MTSAMPMDMSASAFFSAGPFMPHGGCYLWTRSLILLHVLSDAVIALAYYSIPFTILYFVRHRRGLKFQWTLLSFALFVLACGATHVLEIWNIWHADYWLSGGVKALTALVSVATAILLVQKLPKALALPSADALQRARDQLEIRVQERTAELLNVTKNLQAEITEHNLAEQHVRESQAKLDAALASMTDAVFISDAAGQFVEFNNAFATFHRFKSKADCARNLASYPDILEVFLPDGELAPLDMWAVPRALRGESATNAEYTLRRKDTGETWVGSYSFNPIRDKEGHIVGSVVVGRDVTERNFAEQQIISLNASLEVRVHERTTELEAANRELESFAYSVSHDLRAPLRGIDGWSHALIEDYGDRLDDQGREYLARVCGEAQRMGELIDDLLQLSRLTRVEMRREPVDLSAIARAILADLLRHDPQRQVDTLITPDLTAIGDPHLLELVLQNLLQNAWKFTGKTPHARIEVGLTHNIGDTTSIPLDPPAFFIRDNGAGFDMAHTAKLFAPFQRLHRQSEFSGTGVGLATVQRIIHRHGGQISAAAQRDLGATFYFTIPANQPPS